MGDAILRIPRDARVRAYSTRDTYDGIRIMAERRRSAHAIDDQNNGGRSQQENHVTRYLVIYEIVIQFAVN